MHMRSAILISLLLLMSACSSHMVHNYGDVKPDEQLFYGNLVVPTNTGQFRVFIYVTSGDKDEQVGDLVVKSKFWNTVDERDDGTMKPVDAGDVFALKTQRGKPIYLSSIELSPIASEGAITRITYKNPVLLKGAGQVNYIGDISVDFSSPTNRPAASIQVTNKYRENGQVGLEKLGVPANTNVGVNILNLQNQPYTLKGWDVMMLRM